MNTRRAAGRRSGEMAGIGIDAVAVGVGQLIAFAYPLVSLPLLARILGAHSLGRLIVVFAVLQLLVRLSDYGFSVSAVRRLAVSRDRAERSKVIGSTLGAAVLLWCIGTIIMVIVVISVPSLRPDVELYLIGAAVVGAGLGFPPWLLQGLRLLVQYAVVTALARVLALAGLVLTVHSVDDLDWALIWQFAPLAMATVIVWPYLLTKGIRLHIPRAGDVVESLDDGKHLFWQSIATSATGPLTSVALGIVSSPGQVAYFGAAERFGNAGRGVLYGVVNAMLPRMTDTRSESRGSRILILGGLGAGFATAGTLLMACAGWLIPWFLGDGFESAIPVTRLVGAALVVTGGVAVLELRLNAARCYRQTAFALTAAAVIHLLLLIPFGSLYGALGAGAVLVISETAALGILLVITLRRRTRAASVPTTAVVVNS